MKCLASLLRVSSIATPFLIFLSAKMEPEGDDATGRVTAGSIRVKGFLFRLESLPPRLDLEKLMRCRHMRDMHLYCTRSQLEEVVGLE